MIVAIEGLDLAGKGTQADMLHAALEERNITVCTFHFPKYETRIGKEIHDMLHVADGGVDVPPQVLHCLQAANKWEHLYMIEEACREQQVVIMDRYHYSNHVYGLANGMPAEWITGLEDGIPEADIIILLDLSVEESFRRRPSSRDVYEDNRAFLEKVHKEYEDLACRHKNCTRVRADRSMPEVHADILRLVLDGLKGS